jgi:hypothetical protein
MTLDEQARRLLVETLSTSGWVIEGDFIYAPRRTIWFLCSDPWQGDLSEMLEGMQGRLDRIRRHGAHPGDDDVGFQESLDDTGGLVRILKQPVQTD